MSGLDFGWDQGGVSGFTPQWLYLDLTGNTYLGFLLLQGPSRSWASDSSMTTPSWFSHFPLHCPAHWPPDQPSCLAFLPVPCFPPPLSAPSLPPPPHLAADSLPLILPLLWAGLWWERVVYL